MTTEYLYVLFNKGNCFDIWRHNLLPKNWIFITSLPIENPKHQETTFDSFTNTIRTIFGFQPFTYTYYEMFAGDKETNSEMKTYLQKMFSNLQTQGIVSSYSIRTHYCNW